MELFIKPWDNKVVAKLYKEFCGIEKFRFDKDLFDFIEKNPDSAANVIRGWLYQSDNN